MDAMLIFAGAVAIYCLFYVLLGLAKRYKFENDFDLVAITVIGIIAYAALSFCNS